MSGILSLISRIPTVVWIVVGLVVLFPCVSKLVHGAGKLMLIATIFVALCFIFPSILSSFMDTAQLTYDAERKSITNRNGVEITWDDIKSKGRKVKDIVDSTEKAIDDIQDVQTQIKDLKSTDTEVSNNYIEIVITDDMINRAAEIGIVLTKDSVITMKDSCFYLKTNNSNLLLSDDMCRAIGIK